MTSTFPQSVQVSSTRVPASFTVGARFITFCILCGLSMFLKTHFPDYDWPIREPVWVMLSPLLIDMPYLSACWIIHFNCISPWWNSPVKMDSNIHKLILSGLSLQWIIMLLRKPTLDSEVQSPK